MLITLPPTLTSTGAAEEAADPEDSAEPELPEQAPSQHKDTATPAMIARRTALDGVPGVGLIHQTNHERVASRHVG